MLGKNDRGITDSWQQGACRGVVLLDECADDTERCQPQILKGPRLGGGVKEGVEKEGDLGLEEELPGFGVGGDTLEEGEGVADAVGGLCVELRRV